MKKQWKAAAYLRLSSDDGNLTESMSITNQKLLITEWLKDKTDLVLVDYYVDDGYTGTNFDRPSFNNMMFDLKINRVDCVIVKDLSRLGRNSTKVGELIDEYFPTNNIRFIAINDNLDTYGYTDENDVTGFKLICNEFYVKDTSKKVKSALRASAKKGNYVGALAPYGYIKNHSDYHKLEIDPTAASVVRRIFTEFASGKSGRMIADGLNSDGTLTPSNYRKAAKAEPIDAEVRWNSNTIMQILHNRAYIGDLVQHKREKLSYKLKTRRVTSDDERIVSFGTHEAIIDAELFAAVEELFLKKKTTKQRKTKSGTLIPVLFSGMLRCFDCGSKMPGTIKNGKRCYRCYKYNTSGTSACSSHLIFEDELLNYVLFDIRRIIHLYEKDGLQFAQSLINFVLNGNSDEIAKAKIALATNKSTIKDIENKMMLIYNDKKEGNISDKMFSLLSKRYDDNLYSLIQECEKCESLIKNANSSETVVINWLKSIMDFKDVIKPSSQQLHSIIDEIKVKSVGQKSRIIIRYKIGNINLDRLTHRQLKIA